MNSMPSSRGLRFFARAGSLPALLALLLCLGACATIKEVIPRESPQETMYRETTTEWTREGSLYRGVETMLLARATLKSKQWRQAYASRVRDLYVLTPAEHDELLDELSEKREESLEIVLSLSAQDFRHANLMRTEAWTIFLESNGRKLYPSSLERLGWPAEKLRAFFPYYSTWQQFYLLTFPRPETPEATLVIAGPAGKIDLTWNSF
jgi:hypothetical protein